MYFHTRGRRGLGARYCDTSYSRLSGASRTASGSKEHCDNRGATDNPDTKRFSLRRPDSLWSENEVFRLIKADSNP